MLYYSTLHGTTLYYAILHCTVLYCACLYDTTQVEHAIVQVKVYFGCMICLRHRTSHDYIPPKSMLSMHYAVSQSVVGNAS